MVFSAMQNVRSYWKLGHCTPEKLWHLNLISFWLMVADFQRPFVDRRSAMTIRFQLLVFSLAYNNLITGIGLRRHQAIGCSLIVFRDKFREYNGHNCLTLMYCYIYIQQPLRVPGYWRHPSGRTGGHPNSRCRRQRRQALLALSYP